MIMHENTSMPTPSQPRPKTPTRLRRSLREGNGLALRDLIHDRKTTLVLIFTVAAIIAPVLLLFGLKNGVVATMIEDLLNDPRNLQVTVYGNTRLERDWFETYAARPDVRFIVPRTRTISATIDLANADGQLEAAVELIPTAPGDPLLPAHISAPSEPTRILITDTLAERLGVDLGDPLIGIVRRGVGANRQTLRLELFIDDLLPETSYSGNAIFTHLDLLVGTEDYRDGLRDDLAPDALDGALASTRTHFANARVFATDLAGVDSVAAAMRDDGIEIRTEAAKIQSVLALVDTLKFVFLVVAIIGTLGGVLALGGALWVNVDRKRRSLGLLRLYGFGNGTIVLVPLAQSAIIAAAGLVLAYGAYLAGAAVFNNVLGQNLAGQGYVCRLDPEHLRDAAGITLLVALLAASAAGFRASRVDAAECLREL
jgi:putative ABC transport system permease protein